MDFKKAAKLGGNGQGMDLGEIVWGDLGDQNTLHEILKELM